MAIYQSDLKPSWRNKHTLVYKSTAVILYVFGPIIAPIIICLREKNQFKEYYKEVGEIWRIK